MAQALVSSSQASVDGVAQASIGGSVSATLKSKYDEQLTASLVADTKKVGMTAANMRLLYISNQGVAALTAFTVDGGTVDVPMGIGDAMMFVGATVTAAFAAAFSGAGTFTDMKFTTPAGTSLVWLKFLALSNE